MKIIIFFSTLMFFQNINNLQIITEQIKIREVIEFEKKLSDKFEIIEKNVSLSNSVYPLLKNYDIVNPLIIKRETSDFIPLYIEYFYSKSDSILRYISYDWEKARYGNLFVRQKIWMEEGKKLNYYNSEYEKLKAFFIEEFGIPEIQDHKPKKIESSSGDNHYLSRDTVWETKLYFAKLNLTFSSMTQRIRLQYYWKK